MSAAATRASVTPHQESFMMNRFNQNSGKIGYALLWLLGVPLPALILIYLIAN